MRILVRKRGNSVGVNVALLILRLAFGGIMMAHGGQKLFGWFKGPGMQGTSTMMESMGMRPGKLWAALAGGAEFGGGLLTALGFLNPFGPLATFGAMAMATAKVHWGKPFWVSQGGPEFTTTNMTIASALMAAGPGDYSMDKLLGTRLPRWLVIPGLVGVGGTVAYALYAKRFPQVQQQVTQALQSAQQSVQQTVRRATQPAAVGAAEGTTGAAGTTGTTGAPGATGRKTQPAGTR
jgi:putative oxidoreductase